MDWTALRAEFPALRHWTYLNTATFGQLPKCATEAVNRHFAHRDETACGDFLDWYTDADRLRASLASLIGATSEDIAFVPSAAHALGLVMSGIALETGDNVVTLAGDFPNQLYLPQLREVPWDRFYESVDENTRLVALSEVNYATGFRAPIADISKFLHGRGVPFYLDGTQSIGALQFDVKKTPVDVLAVHAYKWMLSPPGAGFFYICPEFRATLAPTVVGWRSHRDWRNVDQLHHGTPEFKDSAEKYEGGGLPSALLYAMEASVDLMKEAGPANIEARVLQLAAILREHLRSLGGICAETCSQIVAAKLPGKNVSALARELKTRKILVSARHGHLRVSPHCYNNEEDIFVFERELRKLL